MNKADILKINTIGKISSIYFENNQKLNNFLINTHMLYWWYLDEFKYEAYGNIEQNILLDINNHKLPKNGNSDILNECSDNIDIYGNIYIIKSIKGKKQSIVERDYNDLVKNIINISTQELIGSYSESEINYEEEIDENIKQLENKENITVNENTLDFDVNDY